MGLLDIFKNGEDKAPKEEKVIPWIQITEMDQLGKIDQDSKNKTQVVFKHSTRCGISKMVIRQFESSYVSEDKVDLFYLDLLNYRPISLEIASKFQVMHQSPQMLIIKNGKVVHHASHHEIFAQSIEEFV